MAQKFTVVVPTKLNDESLVPFFSGWKWRVPAQDQVEYDFRTCEFLSPWALCQFAAYGLYLAHAKQKEVQIHFDPDSVVGKYLVRSGLCKLFGDEEGAPADWLNFTVAMQNIRDEASIYPFASSVSNLLELKDEEAEEAVKYSLTELLRNVIQHSGSPIGAVAMAQYFPKTRSIELVVADTGIGIREHIARTYPEADTDMQALNLALLPHHSGTFGPRMYSSMKDNAGLGLFFVNEIAIRGAGGFALCSGNALLNRWATRGGKRFSNRITTGKGNWPGTFAFVRLQRGLIADFGGLLDVCRQIASESRQDPFLQALDFVDKISDEDVTVVPIKPFIEDVAAAAKVRDLQVIPDLHVGKSVALDFKDIKVITQSFAHALFFQILKQQLHVRFKLQIVNCRPVVRSAIFAVSSYARSPSASD